jgi:transcriptional regulator with XRE-family HTH domain
MGAEIEFGKQLRSLRLFRGLSVREVSQLIGVPATTYRDWEYGKRIQGQPYIRIAQAFGITLDELFGVEKNNIGLEQKLDSIINELQMVRRTLSLKGRNE